MNNKDKKVLIAMSADIFHHGHINIINKASKHGKVIISLLSDKTISKYKRVPYLSWNNRKKILENIKGVHKVILQNQTKCGSFVGLLFFSRVYF